MQGRIKQTNADYREMKQRVKSEKQKQRIMLEQIKQKHTEILNLEEKLKQLQAIVKPMQDKGEESLTAGLGYKPVEIVQKENGVERLNAEVTELE